MLNSELWTYVTANLLRMLSYVGWTFCLPYCSIGSCASALFFTLYIDVCHDYNSVQLSVLSVTVVVTLLHDPCSLKQCRDITVATETFYWSKLVIITDLQCNLQLTPENWWQNNNVINIQGVQSLLTRIILFVAKSIAVCLLWWKLY